MAKTRISKQVDRRPRHRKGLPFTGHPDLDRTAVAWVVGQKMANPDQRLVGERHVTSVRLTSVQNRHHHASSPARACRPRRRESSRGAREAHPPDTTFTFVDASQESLRAS